MSVPFSVALYSDDGRIQMEYVSLLLGLQQIPFNGHTIKYQWLRDACRGRFPTTPMEVEQYARCFILYLLGCFLFPNGNEGCYLSLLPPLSNLDRCSTYDWGSAVLSHLF